MACLVFRTFDVFTDTKYKGNPLAVCVIPRDVHPSHEKLQAIAKEFNLSETVFLHERSDTENTWRIQIFTTDMELTFAGHPTIGTAYHVLSHFNLSSAKLVCQAGPIPVSMKDGYAQATIPHNFHLHTQALEQVEVELLQPGLAEIDNCIGDVDVVSPVRGMNFVLIALSSLEALAAVSTTGIAPKVVLDHDWRTGFVGTAYYVYTGERDGVHHYRTRMIETMLEDPATGSMSCGLATLLARKKGQSSFNFTQGVEMGRESHIGVELTVEGSDVTTVVLKGQAVMVMQGSIAL